MFDMQKRGKQFKIIIWIGLVDRQKLSMTNSFSHQTMIVSQINLDASMSLIFMGLILTISKDWLLGLAFKDRLVQTSCYFLNSRLNRNRKKVISDMLKWDNLQHLKNSSKLFTPKNSSEADLISNKYDIKGPIWTDFVRVNPLSFYRKVLLILSKAHAEILIPRMDSIKQKKFIKTGIFHSTRTRISV